MNFANIAAKAHQVIEAQKAVRDQAHTAADKHFKENTQAHYKELDEIETLCSDEAFELACNLGIAPFNTNGGRHQPTTVYVEREGILLIWDLDDRDYRSKLITWAEIQEAMQAKEADS
jgi:hypothetical protein